MPTTEKFLSSFGFIKGTQFDDYILEEVTSTHNTIKRYQQYEYDIYLRFYNDGKGTWESLTKVLQKIYYQNI